MNKNINLNSESKKYVDNYRALIKNKVRHQSEEKDLMETLVLDPTERQKAYAKMKIELKQFVDSLKSDKNYEFFTNIYHENIKKAREFNKFFYDKNDPSQTESIWRKFKDSKETFFKSTPKEWNKLVEWYARHFGSLTKQQKEEMLIQVDKMSNNKEYFKKQMASSVEVLKKILDKKWDKLISREWLKGLGISGSVWWISVPLWMLLSKWDISNEKLAELADVYGLSLTTFGAAILIIIFLWMLIGSPIHEYKKAKKEVQAEKTLQKYS